MNKKLVHVLSTLTLCVSSAVHAMHTKKGLVYPAIEGAVPFAFNNLTLISYAADQLLVQSFNQNGKPSPHNWSTTLPGLLNKETLHKHGLEQHEFGKKKFSDTGSLFAFRARIPRTIADNSAAKTYEVDFKKKTVSHKPLYDIDGLATPVLVYSDNNLYGIKNTKAGITVVSPKGKQTDIPGVQVWSNWHTVDELEQDYLAAACNNSIGIACYMMHKNAKSGLPACVLYNTYTKTYSIVESKVTIDMGPLYPANQTPHNSIAVLKDAFFHRYQAGIGKDSYAASINFSGTVTHYTKIVNDWAVSDHLEIKNEEFRQELYSNSTIHGTPGIYITSLKNKSSSCINTNKMVLVGAKLQWYLQRSTDGTTYTAHKA